MIRSFKRMRVELRVVSANESFTRSASEIASDVMERLGKDPLGLEPQVIIVNNRFGQTFVHLHIINRLPLNQVNRQKDLVVRDLSDIVESCVRILPDTVYLLHQLQTLLADMPEDEPSSPSKQPPKFAGRKTRNITEP